MAGAERARVRMVGSQTDAFVSRDRIMRGLGGRLRIFVYPNIKGKQMKCLSEKMQ